MDDRATVLPAVLALAFGGLLLLGVAIELGRWGSSHMEAANVADAGAQAGASVVSPDELRQGAVVIDASGARAAASSAATAARPRVGRSVSVTVSGNRVCVAVEQPFRSRLLSALGLVPGVVRASSCAEPARG